MHLLLFSLLSFTPAWATADSGADLYNRHCSACHGDDGNGASWARTGLNPPPRNFTSKQSRQNLSEERMINSVTHGRPGTAMQPFKDRLSKTQITQVVAYVRSRFMGAASQKAKEKIVEQPKRKLLENRMLGTYPNQLKGDVSLGETFFQHNCYVCHGRQGNGEGPRSKFIRPRPRNFLSKNSQSFNRATLFTAIADGKPGTVMPAWKAVLEPQEIANVAEYILQAFILKGLKKNRR